VRFEGLDGAGVPDSPLVPPELEPDSELGVVELLDPEDVLEVVELAVEGDAGLVEGASAAVAGSGLNGS
jgi:hypothetical protein